MFDDDGRVVKSTNDTNIGDVLEMRLSDGSVSAVVKEVNHG